MSRWKIDLSILWFGSFLVMSGMTMIIPFLPLYLQDLGLEGEHNIAMWAGAIFAANFVTSFLFQPLWSKLADRFGYKVMLLRSSIGMAIVTILMGLSQDAWHLLLLRLLNGTISGFNPVAIALISSSAPKERMGFAMGVLQSGTIAGTILGPVIGGVLAEFIGFRPIFFLTGGCLIIASLLVLILVRDQFDRETAAAQPQMSIIKGFSELRSIPQLQSLFTVTFVIQFANLSTMPLMPLYIQQLHSNSTHIALYAGLVGSVTGFSNMFASPILGRLADRIGAQSILKFSLFGAAIICIPQAFVTTIWQLLIIRFLLGICMAGLNPTVNALIRKYTPDGMVNRAYGFNSSFLSLGNIAGPTIGGLTSGLVGIPGVFLLSSAFMFVNGFWVRARLPK